MTPTKSETLSMVLSQIDEADIYYRNRIEALAKKYDSLSNYCFYRTLISELTVYLFDCETYDTY